MRKVCVNEAPITLYEVLKRPFQHLRLGKIDESMYRYRVLSRSDSLELIDYRRSVAKPLLAVARFKCRATASKPQADMTRLAQILIRNNKLTITS